MRQFAISRKFLDAVKERQIFMHPKFWVPFSLPVPKIIALNHTYLMRTSSAEPLFAVGTNLAKVAS